MEGLFKKYEVTDPWGQIVIQTCLYGYVLFLSANMIGDGAELLLLVPKYSSLVGSIVIPILGAVPDGMMVLCSGLGPDAQNQLKVGIGALAGSTIMLLTLPWLLAVISGRVSIENGKPRYTRPNGATEHFEKLKADDATSIFRSGVGVGDEVRKNAKIMLATSISYLVIQIPAFIVDKPGSASSHSSQISFEKVPAHIGFAMCIIFFFGYLCLMMKQQGDPEGLHHAKVAQKAVNSILNGEISLRGVMHEFKETTEVIKGAKSKADLDEALLDSSPEAQANVAHLYKVLEPFFVRYDTDKDHAIELGEFRMVMNDMGEKLADSTVEEIFHAADKKNKGSLDFDDFVSCIAHYALMESADTLAKPMGRIRTVCWRKSQAPVLDSGDGAYDDDDDEEEDIPQDLADLPPAEQQKKTEGKGFQRHVLGHVSGSPVLRSHVRLAGPYWRQVRSSKILCVFRAGTSSIECK